MVSDEQVKEQYRTSANLDIRIEVHERFSTNKYPWMQWVFDHFEVPNDGRILEIGCGVGKLWSENEGRIGDGWRVVLSDFSAGMLGRTRENLMAVGGRFEFLVLGVDDIPFAAESFDVVVANHMLYYAADVDAALAGIRRVLKRGGRLYASTNGLSHLREVDELVAGFRGGLRPVASVMEVFNLENGRDYLERHFETVRVERQENALLIDDPAALAAFCLSMTRTGIADEKRPEFVAFIEEEMRKIGGMIRVQKDGGLFVGARKRNN